MNKVSFFGFILLGTCFQAFSQQEADKIKDTVNLDEIVVTGTPVKVNRNNVPMAISVVDRNEIAQSNESALLPILNGRVPGLFVTERGITGFGVATGAAGQVTIRGIGGSPTTGVLMLIDGHPQFMGIFGHPLSDSYVASDVERIEVIRGPASILYGSNAMGGVINIITRKQDENGFHGNASVMYGSFNTQKYMGSGGYKKNKFSFFASLNHDETKGHRPNSDFSITNGYLKLGYELNTHLTASTDFSLAKFRATDPGPDTLSAVPGASLDITRGYWAFTLEDTYDKYSGTAKLFYNFGEHKISDGFHSLDANYGLNLNESFRLFVGNTISVGVDYLHYGGKAEIEKAIVFKDTTVHELGIYGFVQQTLFGKLVLNAGLRLQEHNVYGKVWVPAAGFAFRYSSAGSWKGSVSKGFRSPTIQELFFWNHNPNLNPENIMNYETGIIQNFFNNKLKVEITGYFIKGDNLIINIPNQGLMNAGSISNKGLEVAVHFNLVNNLDINFTYSHILMKAPVYATPRNQLFAGFQYKWNKLVLMASIDRVDHLNTDPTPPVYYQSYTLLNARISYQIFRFADAFIMGENLLNQKYETNRYYFMPGITFFGGVNFRF